MNLTEKEIDLLTAMRDSEYHDGRHPVEGATWVDCLRVSFPASGIGGVMASLTQKGLAWTDGEACSVTQEGFDAIISVAKRS
jgi:hypothetical protein